MMKYRFIPLILATLTWNCTTKEIAAGLEALESDIQARFESVDGDFALAFKVLDDKEASILIREREVFHAASTMKTPVMIEVYKQSAEGKFVMEDSVLVRNEFRSIVDSSLYSMDLGVDSQEELYERIGKKSTYYDLTYEMITKSSNLATNILMDIVGAGNANQSMRDLGAMDIQVLRGVEDLKAFGAGLNNSTTALDLMIIMEAIATGKAGNKKNTGAMMEILKQQKFKDMIPALLPDEVAVAHKTGSITGVQHDSGIVILPGGKKYVLVVLSKNLASAAEGKKTIAEVSKMIYDYIINQ